MKTGKPTTADPQKLKPTSAREAGHSRTVYRKNETTAIDFVSAHAHPPQKKTNPSKSLQKIPEMVEKTNRFPDTGS
jgi:hypothetical protein